MEPWYKSVTPLANTGAAASDFPGAAALLSEAGSTEAPKAKVAVFVGSNHRAAVISLPRSHIEMTDWDLQWQDRIVKVIGAVAKPLLVNDEAEISEVIRRRLFENLGPEKTQKLVARAYADWCFERRTQLPPEWTAVDTSATEKKAKEFLQARFEACYPFWASQKWTRPRWTMPPWRWRPRLSSSSGSARTVSRSTTRPRSTRRSTTAGHPWTKRTRSSPRSARWSKTRSNAARAFPWNRSRPTAVRCRTRRD